MGARDEQLILRVSKASTLTNQQQEALTNIVTHTFGYLAQLN